jgi:hypothetical protein
MGNPQLQDPTRAHRHRYIIEDPVRFSCLCAAAALVFVPQVPFFLTLLVVLVVQLAPIAMVARTLDRGWSRRWGRHVHESVFASSLSMDFAGLAACTVVGALLLVRHFNGSEVVRPLGMLAAAICFLPDIRLCRWVAAGEPVEASQQLREGYFHRDPVPLGALLATAVLCTIDRTTLNFVLLSLLFLQFNTVLMFLDKYLPEIEVRRSRGVAGLLLEREGRRFTFCLAPLLLVPVRVYLGDNAGWIGAAVIGGAILVPDLLRIAWAGLKAVGGLFRVTPAPPSTLVLLPKA